MSPQLLLVLMVALVTATLTGLVTRKPFYYLPLYWILSVCCLLVGQELGTIAGWSSLTVGDVQLGVGLAVNLILLVVWRIAYLWYTHTGR
jgi:uncharacterized membrane protein